MRSENSFQAPLGRIATLVLVLALPLLSSCFEPASVFCPSGLVCPSDQKCATKQDVCIKTDCGDGLIQALEACDDGNIKDGDGCNFECKSIEICGNGVRDVGEVCDDGNNDNKDKCSAD